MDDKLKMILSACTEDRRNVVAKGQTPTAVPDRRQARAGADHPTRGRFLRRAHLPHARHGLQQRATYLPARNLVDQAIKGGLAGGLSAALIAVARFAPANLKSEAKSSW